MFKKQCDRASAALHKMDEWVHNLEEGYLLLEKGPPTEDEIAMVAVLTRIIRDFWAVANKLYEEWLPPLGQEEPNVAYAVQLAADELSKRVRDVQSDLEYYARKPMMQAPSTPPAAVKSLN